MTQRLQKKSENQGSRPASRGTQKLFYNETEDEYEESKINNHDGLDVMMSNIKKIPQPHFNPNPLEHNSQSQQEDKFSSFSQSDSLEFLQVDYQLMCLQSVIENSFEEFVNIECILQSNILHDIGRLRYILVHYVESTIEKAIDDNGEFSYEIYFNLMRQYDGIEHFLYLEYPYLDYDEQQEVEMYELMSEEQFQNQFDLLHQSENIQQIVESVNIQNMLEKHYNKPHSKKQFMKEARESLEGPLDHIVKSKNGLFEQLGRLVENGKDKKKSEEQFKVQIRKETNKKKPSQLIDQNPQKKKNHLQLFNFQPISTNQSNEISTKNLSYQEFVSILEKQKQQQQEKQKQNQNQKQKQKQKQKKLPQQSKKSQFDQILGRKDDQVSKEYMKPFIGEFKKKESDNQLRDMLGLNTPKKEEKQIVEHSTPEFKQNIVHSTEKIPSLSIHKGQIPGLNQNTQNSSKTTISNVPSFMNSSLPTESKKLQNPLKISVPIVGPPQTPFLSNNKKTQGSKPQNTLSMSPPSIINPSKQIQNNSGMIQQRQISLQQPNSSSVPPVLETLKQPNALNNQNNFVTPFNNNEPFQKINKDRVENSNFKNPFQNLKNLQQSSSLNMFSNPQMNQNPKNTNFQNSQVRSQSFSNSAPTFTNSQIFGNQPQISQDQYQNPFIHQSQFNHFNGSNSNFVPQFQSNFNQNLPIPSMAGFLGSQKVLNLGLGNLSIPQNQQTNHQIMNSASNNVQKMSPEQNQVIDKADPTQSKLNEESKSLSVSFKIKNDQNIYDKSVLENMKLKDFVQIFCQQEIRKSYEELYSELLLLKRWKILNFGIDSTFSEKLRYLSHFKTAKKKELLKQITPSFKMKDYEKIKKLENSSETEPFCLMKTLNEKIEQINQQTFFDFYGIQKGPRQYLRVTKTTRFETTQRQFSKIQQIQQQLQQKITHLETAMKISSQEYNRDIDFQGYLSMEEQLASIGETLKGVEKWIFANGLGQQNVDFVLKQTDKNSQTLKQGNHLIFDCLCQLYSNINRIDSELQIMTSNAEKLKK